MVSILDIGPMSKEVTINGVKIPVVGVSAEAFMGILFSFPQLRRVVAQKKLDGEMLTELVAQAPEAAAAIMAAGLRNGTDSQESLTAWARDRAAGEQFEILQATVEMTFPQGLGSFVAAVQKVLDSAGALGWGPDTKSPVPSSSASATGT
jgi:hypothetical protein